jgi:hypothetical protein
LGCWSTVGRQNLAKTLGRLGDFAIQVREMPLLKLRNSEMKTYYDVLDAVRRWPGIYLGGVDSEWIRGTRMPRLQAFLTALLLVDLEEGEPPFHDFGRWFSVRVEGISDSHNLPIHWLEERENGADSAFEHYFTFLDEYRACHAVTLQTAAGPFNPNFLVGMDNPQPPKHPDALILAQYQPSKVYFWGAVHGSQITRSSPFFRTAARARREASECWGIERGGWTKS